LEKGGVVAVKYSPSGQIFTPQNIEIVASVKLLGSDKVIAKAIRDELIRVLNASLFRAVGSIDKKVKRLVAQKLRETKEYESLMGMGLSSLRGHFGISNTADVEFVVEYVAEMIDIVMTKFKGTSDSVQIGLKFVADLPQMVEDMKVMKIGIQTTEKGEDLPWLEWLLFAGGKRIIRDYFVLFKSSGLLTSRSGQAIMVKGKAKRWGVPLQYQGTKSNNWVTRTLNDTLGDMSTIIYDELSRIL
jgi:hypothetical protein